MTTSLVEGDIVYYKEYLPLHEKFMIQAKKTPDALAVVDVNKSLTYRELDEKSGQLANYLMNHANIKLESVCGIYMPKCVDYVVAYIAILKAGGAYSPLDLSYPMKLMGTLLDNSNVSVVITLNKNKGTLPDTNTNILVLDEEWETNIEPLEKTYREGVDLSNLAYLVFSGGSTGTPKSISCPHFGAVNSYIWREKITPFIEGDRVASNVFFVWELLRPLLFGYPLYVIPDETIYNPTEVANFIEKYKITRVLFTPSCLQAVLDLNSKERLVDAFDSIRLIYLCGEVVTNQLYQQFKDIFPQGKQLWNLYSVSECHDVSAGNIDELMNDSYASTGHIADNCQIYVLNEANELVKRGEVGELYVGGVCLAREYVGLEERTKERFIENPFKSKNPFKHCADNRLYKTGDLAKVLPDGSLEIRGRCDSMKKIRGYSVEMTTVEAILAKHPDIATCAVDIEDNEDRILVAWLVLSKPTTTAGDIREYLKAELPHFMIPNVFMKIPHLPIHPVSGKLERGKLPSTVECPDNIMKLHRAPARLPRTDDEKRLIDIITKVFHEYNDPIGVDDNLNDIGGTSFKMALLYSKIKESWPKTALELTDLYKCPTAELLAENLHSCKSPTIYFADEVDEHIDFLKQKQLDIRHQALTADHVKGIFLTGATGFLGATLLRDLIEHYDQAKIYCLVRAGNAEEGLNRLVKNLIHYTIWQESYLKKIIVVPGSLEKERFGLTPSSYHQMVNNTQLIVHNGAKVDFISSYEQMKPANVIGTQNILSMATEKNIIPITLVSTTGVYAFDGQSNLSLATEDMVHPSHTFLTSGYGQSKWVADQMMVKAKLEYNLPISIYRCGDICGHSRTGMCNLSHDFVRFIQGIISMKLAPKDHRIVDVTPVDMVSKSIITSQCHHDSKFIFNVVHPEPIRMIHIVKYIKDQLGYSNIKLVDPDIFINTIKECQNIDLLALWPIFQKQMNSHDIIYTTSLYKKENCVDSLDIVRNMVDYLIDLNKIEPPIANPMRGGVAIITGGSSGIGAGIARYFAKNGIKTVITARREKKLQEIKANIESTYNTACEYVTLDVRDMKQWQSVVEFTNRRFGRIDALIQCAGIMVSTFMRNGLVDEWSKMVDINIKGVSNGIAAVLPIMRNQKKGDIINVSSDAGREVFETLSVYSGTKAAVEFITKGTRKELFGENIRLSTIQPGDVATEILEDFNQPDRSQGVYDKSMLLKKILEPEDIAKLVFVQLTAPRHVGVWEILVEPTE